jgi:hypothetical protein
MQRFTLCTFCKYRHYRKPTCDAYPGGIPQRFLSGQSHHLEPAEGDHGIQFEERPDLPASCRRIVQRIREAHARSKQGNGHGDEVA